MDVESASFLALLQGGGFVFSRLEEHRLKTQLLDYEDGGKALHGFLVSYSAPKGVRVIRSGIPSDLRQRGNVI